MTEHDWLTCTNPQSMLDFLRTIGTASERKLRLFAVTCCRRIWPLLVDERSRRAVEIAERHSDGDVDKEQLWVAQAEARRTAEAAHWENQPGPVQTAAEAVVPVVAEHVGPDEVRYVVESAAEAAGDQATDDTWHTPGKTDHERWAAEQTIYREAVDKECEADAAHLRCIFGNPFRPVSLDTSWLTRPVLTLARSGYEERKLPEGTLDPGRLAALADALEESGCTDAELLAHVRSPPRYRQNFNLRGLESLPVTL
jgi:hypothetical protein